MTPPTTHRRPFMLPTRWVVCLCAAAWVLAGCNTPLYAPGEARSQYDKSAAIRETRAPDFIYDEFGARRPNIRGRLLGAE
jgi:hypothetical protein